MLVSTLINNIFMFIVSGSAVLSSAALNAQIDSDWLLVFWSFHQLSLVFLMIFVNVIVVVWTFLFSG